MKTGKKTQGLLWMVNCERLKPSTVVVSENVFCQGMVVLLNPVCNWLSEMLHVYNTCCSFRDVMTSKTLASIQ